MADVQSHINQAKKNLAILSVLNKGANDAWDWQVTAAYYVAVHVMNAHIAKVANLHYSTHDKLKNALYKPMSPARIDTGVYVDYGILENQSRRARYLCNDTNAGTSISTAHITFDVHLKRAIQKLDSIMDYMSNKHAILFPITVVDCIEIKTLSLKYFKYIKY
jgi:hypothetical protein